MADFKNNLSDENQKVIAILKDISEGYELETVLDIGSGLGDITANALPYHRVIHLDKEDYSQYPVAESHLREIDDIFSYVPKEKITTLLMCHVLQYIDDDRARLDQKIEDL